MRCERQPWKVGGISGVGEDYRRRLNASKARKGKK